jgi:GNAT superfamily N-acetyltransferase
MTRFWITLPEATSFVIDRIAEMQGGEIFIPKMATARMTDFAAAIAQHDVWLLEDDDGLAAVLELDDRDDHLWIENVAVDPKRQGRGLGRWLLGFAEGEARRLGRSELRLMTNERYTKNIAMYERYGYRETHREPYRGSDLVHFRKRRRP